MNNIIHQTLNLPRSAPVMVLQGTLLMPDALLPLFIFEQRYREMLSFSLHADRVICIAMAKPGVSEAAATHDFFDVCGLGLIRACVTEKEGTSHLILHGIARVRLSNFVQESPFYVAEIQELATHSGDREQTRLLSAKVIEKCLRYKAKEFEMAPGIEKQLPKLSNPEVLANVVTNAFIHDPFRQQNILQENGIPERLRMILDYLQ